MADRNLTNAKSERESAPRSTQGDPAVPERDDDPAMQPDPVSERSAASRPRGHTEDPDKTL